MATTRIKPEKPKEEKDCGCVKLCCCCCDCSGDHNPPPPPPKCCRFAIYLSRVRIRDTSGDDPLGENEITISGFANGVAVTYPSPTTWINITRRQGWRTIDKQITIVETCGTDPVFVQLWGSVIEWDKIANSSEIGESDPSFMELRCGQQPPVITQVINLEHLTNLPTISGRVEIEFRAYPI